MKLARQPASSRPLLWASSLACASTAALLPVAAHRLGPTTSFLPAVLAVVACVDLMSLYLLAGEYLDNGDRRMLLTAAAYVASLTLMTGYALAFPGVISAHAPLAATPSVAPWLYICWHTAFPCILGAAWAPYSRTRFGYTAKSERAGLLRLTTTATAIVSAGIVAFLVLDAGSLPVLIKGLDITRMTKLTAPVVLPLVTIALVSAWLGTRRRSGPERWSVVAVLVCLCDLTLTYFSRYRFSLGWYVGRSLTVIAAGVVLVAMLAAFRRLKAHAEFDASHDALTGLANRRHALDALEQMTARAHRSASSLAVVAVDLDWFKQVNDRYGHHVGDELLAAIGQTLSDSLRKGDVAARIGGEEFLLLLPDTSADGAMIVAERTHGRLATVDIAAMDGPLTASLGVACLEPDIDGAELLRRADAAMYRAKAAGRNRTIVHTAGTQQPAPLTAA